MFQHAVLIVANVESHTAGVIKPKQIEEIDPITWGPDYKYHVQNVEIYIGNSPNFLENPKCPGGPFMVRDDPLSYTDTEKHENVWRHGEEAWCNLEGQYTHIVANYAH